MRGVALTILIATLTWASSCSVSAADTGKDDGSSVLTRPPRGSLAAQLRLKLQLQMAGGVSLATSLDHNRKDWESLSPDQREQFRNAVYTYLTEDPKAQDELLRHYATFLSLDKKKQEAYRRRAKWVKAVVATFTPAEREKLRKMSSTDRARALIARRDELVREGKLKLDAAPAPASAPAQPVKKGPAE